MFSPHSVALKSQDQVQPDLRVGDALVVVGSSSLPEAGSEEQALSLAAFAKF